ncbi:MAG: hypothetical protein L0Y79_02535 [Chlorobi bacterium]|nr:hypothetical protein [Chlorobiota bacterium]MCI0717046.1 hypothetical protein [Chlorobiota bacterium]
MDIYEEYSKIINSGNNNIPRPEMAVGFTLNPLKSVSNDDLYKILLEKSNDVFDLSFLQKSYLGIEAIIKNRTLDYDRFFDDNKQAVEKFNNLVTTFYKELQNVYEKYETYDEKTQKILLEIDKLIESFNDDKFITKHANVYEHAEKLFIPLMEILKKNDLKFLRATTENLNRTYNYLKEIRKQFYEIIRDNIKGLELVYDHFNQLLTKYEKYLDKKFKRIITAGEKK